LKTEIIEITDYIARDGFMLYSADQKQRQGKLITVVELRIQAVRETVVGDIV
jgi:hypothetical protein